MAVIERVALLGLFRGFLRLPEAVQAPSEAKTYP
jgi:hypothetical protein